MAPADAASSRDAGVPDSGGDESVGSGYLPETGPGEGEDASEDTTVESTDASGHSTDAGGHVPEAGVDSSPVLPPACIPPSNSDTLPFAVDDRYASSGYEGDAVYGGAITLSHDTTCGQNRSSADALGVCHTILYTPIGYGMQLGAGMTAMGWAGVAWQYPADNWGTQPGYAIPPGAKTVSFSARGAAGGEVVSFWFGGSGSYDPCADPLSGNLQITLSTSWTAYSIPVSGPYAPAVLTGFGFSVSKSSQTALPQAQAITFYVDDIRWEM